jgi:hypothetical protein
MNHAIELRNTTDKTVKEICAITGVSQASLLQAKGNGTRKVIETRKYFTC